MYVGLEQRLVRLEVVVLAATPIPGPSQFVIKEKTRLDIPARYYTLQTRSIVLQLSNILDQCCNSHARRCNLTTENDLPVRTSNSSSVDLYGRHSNHGGQMQVLGDSESSDHLCFNKRDSSNICSLLSIRASRPPRRFDHTVPMM